MLFRTLNRCLTLILARSAHAHRPGTIARPNGLDATCRVDCVGRMGRSVGNLSRPSGPSWKSGKLGLLLAVWSGCWFSGANPVQAQYTTKSKEVTDMVDRAVAYLESVNGEITFRERYADGAQMMAAYAVFKVKSDPTNPVVVGGVNVARRLVTTLDNPRTLEINEKVIYQSGLAGLLLATVDVDFYRGDCEKIVEFLVRSERPYGGFGYMDGNHYADTGDLSQTQYGLLCFWTMDQLGIDVPAESVERCAKWLVRVQDVVRGGWGYQGELGRSGQLIRQKLVSNSMTAAGLCSILLAGDFLNFYGKRNADDGDDDIPKAFVRVVEGDDGKPKKVITMDKNDIEPAIERGVNYERVNTYQRAGKAGWHYYYLYSQERYEAFLEIRAKKQNKSPAWYNKGVKELLENQDSDGAFGVKDQDLCGPRLCTSLGILFLIRSTQKAIGEISSGVNKGQFGLPDNLVNVGMVNGELVDKSKNSSTDDILRMMEESGASEMDAAVVSKRMKLSDEIDKRQIQLNRLTRVLRNSQKWEARRVAAILLGRGESLDYVPDLIFALSDPDPEVPRNAEASLRILSRQLEQITIPLDGEPTLGDRNRAIAFWKDWYLGLRPDYVFLE